MVQHKKVSSQHSNFSVLDLARAVDYLVILDDPASDPVLRKAAREWFARCFLKYPIDLRRQALKTAKVFRIQRGA